MHQRLRIAFSRRMGLLQSGIDACDAAIQHVTACSICKKDDTLCSEGHELYDDYMLAQSRAKILMNDDGGYPVE